MVRILLIVTCLCMFWPQPVEAGRWRGMIASRAALRAAQKPLTIAPTVARPKIEAKVEVIAPKVTLTLQEILDITPAPVEEECLTGNCPNVAPLLPPTVSPKKTTTTTRRKGLFGRRRR